LDPSVNRGNFLEIFHSIAEHDRIVKERLENDNGPRNAMYTSPGVQNLILTILGDMVRNSICDHIKEAKIFSSLVDEARDVSNVEKMSIVLRFVDTTGLIHKHFLTFVDTIESIVLTRDKKCQFNTVL